jgi:hypothetical protein
MIKKGTQVYLIQDWDEKGTVSVEKFTVGAWGKQQGFLINGLGGTAKFRIYTEAAKHQNWSCHVVAVANAGDIRTYALVYAARRQALHLSHLERCRDNQQPGYQDAGYQKAIAAQLAALHEPRVVFRSIHA